MSLLARVPHPPPRLKGLVEGKSRRLSRTQSPPAERRHRGQAGQALPLFVLMIFVLTGSVAVVTDVSWFWVNQQKMQRAADAGALAGAVFLPGNVSGAYAAARAATARNGYTDHMAGVLVTPAQETSNRRRLDVSVSGPIGTYFARVFGMNQVAGSAQSKAEFTLPIPMGSPQNYYGVGYFVGPTPPVQNATVNFRSSETTQPAGTWTNPTNAGSVNSVYTTSITNNAQQQFGGFGLQGSTAVPNDPSLVIEGIQVRLQNVFISSSTNGTNCMLAAELSWNGGISWTPAQQTTALNTTNTTDYDIGSSTLMTLWGSPSTHTWAYTDFSNTNFRVRMTWQSGTTLTSACASTQKVSLDDLDVQVWSHTSTTPADSQQPVLPPGGGSPLAPQNFWGAMQSQGVPSVQGDDFMTQYDIRTGTANSNYDPQAYYNYGVDIPANATNGSVWIFDPGFCDVATNEGTGEYWTGDNNNDLPVSAFYQVYNTRATPYDLSDDTRVDSTGDDNTYRRLDLSDQTLGGSNSAGASCGSLSWHNGWWQVASGLSGGPVGTTYRVHTTSTDPSSPTDQKDTTALNSFAIWSSATGGTPRVYGIGAMEAYVRVPGGQSSEFYLAKIDANYASKTMEINLWDPGDTGALSASLQILQPTTTSYSPVNFTYTAARGTNNSNASNCSGTAGSGNAVITNTGGHSNFNGCWLTIQIVLPNTYSAPHPSSDNVTTDGGWWKIRYTMGGSTSNFSTDLTTWKVDILGSPVHLVR